MVEYDGQGYLLKNQVATYTNSFATPQGGLILNINYQSVDGSVRTESLAAIMAGEETLVLLSTADEFLLLNPISPARVVEIAKHALHEPIRLAEAAEAVREPVRSSADATMSISRLTSVEIIVLSGELENQRFLLGEQLRLGREADNDLILPDKMASRHHAILQRKGFVYQIIDLNSANGTYVNEQRITDATVLKNGDIVFIGDTRLTISNRP